MPIRNDAILDIDHEDSSIRTIRERGHSYSSQRNTMRNDHMNNRSFVRSARNPCHYSTAPDSGLRALRRFDPCLIGMRFGLRSRLDLGRGSGIAGGVHGRDRSIRLASTSAICCVSRSVKCSICWRQETPATAITVVLDRGAFDRREQPLLADLLRDLVVLCLVAERSGHAAATGAAFAAPSNRPLSESTSTAPSDQRLLMAMPVEQDFRARVASSR